MSLLSLPLELRESIYRFRFSRGLCIRPYPSPHRAKHRLGTLSLLLVSRSISREVLAVLARSTTFSFPTLSCLRGFISLCIRNPHLSLSPSSSPSFPPFHLSLRRITLQICLDDWLRLLLVPTTGANRWILNACIYWDDHVEEDFENPDRADNIRGMMQGMRAERLRVVIVDEISSRMTEKVAGAIRATIRKKWASFPIEVRMEGMWVKTKTQGVVPIRGRVDEICEEEGGEEVEIEMGD